MKSRILLVEDHALFRTGIIQLLSSEETYEIIGEAGTGLEGLNKVQNLQPDIVLLDISLPEIGGIEVASRIKEKYPHIKVLMVSMQRSVGYLRSALKAGADGYVLKSSDGDEFLVALRAVKKGRQYICSELAEHVMTSFTQDSVEVTNPLDKISLREKEVLILVAEGYSNKEIATKLNVSVKTVDNHRSNVMRKLELHSIRDVIFFALEQKLIEKG